MRPLFSAVLSCAVAMACAQSPQGVYKSNKGGAGTPWEVNGHFTLMWDKTPYLPIGLQVDPTPTAIRAAKTAGFKDVLVDLPATGDAWSDAVAALDETGMSYLIRISSLTPMARGIAVDPAAYRVADITGPRHLDISMAGATRALVVLADKRDGSIIQWSLEDLKDGHLVYEVKQGPSTDAVVLIYPETVSLEQPDYWEGMDDHRDRLLLSLRRHLPGQGLRGIVNPLGRALTLPGKDLRFVPSSPAFRLEFAEFLENRYRNVVSVLRAWALSSDIVSSSEVGESKEAYHTFAEVAGLIPLWSGTRGVPDVWDPARKQVFACDRGRSAMWKDFSEAVGDAESRRFSRMVSSIQDVTDVPVVQEWAGWSSPYETAQPSVNGIGMKAIGSSHSTILTTAARAASSMLRWHSPGWLPATDIDLTSGATPADVAGVFDDLTSLGAKGIFVRSSDPAIVKAVAAEAARRAGDASSANYSPEAIFYPENATNPAATQHLPGGKWWLPCPADGNRIDYGSGFYGYRWTDGATSKIAIWARIPGRVVLHMAAPRKAVFLACDGSDPKPKEVREGVELTLTQSPLIISETDEIPVPDPAYQVTSAEVAFLMQRAEKEHISFQEQQMALTDAYKAFDRNPGGAFTEVRRILHEVDVQMGDFTWAEAEQSAQNSFSETVKSPGCSAGAALALHSSLDAASSYYADYEVPVHSKTDQELWIAARIPVEQRGFLSVRIGSQTFTITGDPVGLYAGGYGWYHLGVTRLLEDRAKVKVMVVGQSPDISVDTLLLAPKAFVPDGVAMPESPPGILEKTSKPKRKRGGGV